MLALDFSIFPQLETDRLQLTRTNVDHVNELLKMRSDPEVMKFIPRPMARTAEEIIEFIAAIDEKISNHEMIN
jgi:ribosomal-protein-alanine N-acetyltransferase